MIIPPRASGEGGPREARWAGCGPQRYFGDDNEALTQKPPPPPCCAGRSPPPTFAGADARQSRSRARTPPASDVKQRILFASGTGEPSNPERATTSCCGATLCDSLPARNKGKRNAGRRGPYHPHAYGVRGAPRKERLAPRLPLSGALACRRSTSALPKGCVVPWCDPGQVSWEDRPRGGGHSADGRPTSSDAPRMPVVMPADMMPGPPGSKADEASPAGTALAPTARHHPDGVPLGRDDSLVATIAQLHPKARKASRNRDLLMGRLRLASIVIEVVGRP